MKRDITADDPETWRREDHTPSSLNHDDTSVKHEKPS